MVAEGLVGMAHDAPAARDHGGEECGEMASTRQERSQLILWRPHRSMGVAVPLRCQGGNLWLLVGVLLISSCGACAPSFLCTYAGCARLIGQNGSCKSIGSCKSRNCPLNCCESVSRSADESVVQAYKV